MSTVDVQKIETVYITNYRDGKKSQKEAASVLRAWQQLQLSSWRQTLTPTMTVLKRRAGNYATISTVPSLYQKDIAKVSNSKNSVPSPPQNFVLFISSIDNHLMGPTSSLYDTPSTYLSPEYLLQVISQNVHKTKLTF